MHLPFCTIFPGKLGVANLPSQFYARWCRLRPSCAHVAELREGQTDAGGGAGRQAFALPVRRLAMPLNASVRARSCLQAVRSHRSARVNTVIPSYSCCTYWTASLAPVPAWRHTVSRARHVCGTRNRELAAGSSYCTAST